MSIPEITARIAKALETRPFEGSLKFDCGKDGVIVLADGTANNQNRDTDCTLTLSSEHLAMLLTGKLNPMTGLMTGKLKLSGNPAVAMKLAKLIG